MPQMTQRTQRGQGRREPVFRSLDAFEVFLERVEYNARHCGVTDQNVRRITKLLRAQFGKGLCRLRRVTFMSIAR